MKKRTLKILAALVTAALLLAGCAAPLGAGNGTDPTQPVSSSEPMTPDCTISPDDAIF